MADVEIIEWECLQLGCDFTGTREECEQHERDKPGHDYFADFPPWSALIGTDREGQA